MPEEHDGQPGLLATGGGRHGREVVDDGVPPVVVRPETHRVVRGRGALVPAVVRGIHRETGTGERLGEPLIAVRVLRHPVRDLDDRSRRALRQPAIDVKGGAIGGADRERAVLHGRESRTSTSF